MTPPKKFYAKKEEGGGNGRETVKRRRKGGKTEWPLVLFRGKGVKKNSKYEQKK
jgi:hypothetical protein